MLCCELSGPTVSYHAGPVCMEKGFGTLPVNPTQAVATVAVRIWFGPHA